MSDAQPTTHPTSQPTFSQPTTSLPNHLLVFASVPHIVSSILASCDRKTLRTVMLVSSYWRDQGLRIIYRNLSTLRPLSEILSGEPNHLSATRWDLFSKVAGMVKSLTVCRKDMEAKGRAKTIVKFATNQGILFPALRLLTCMPSTRCILLFGHQYVTCLSLKGDVRLDRPAFCVMLEHIGARMPGLRKLSFELTPSYAKAVSKVASPVLASLLDRLASLSSLNLPSGFLCPKVMAALTRAPELTGLAVNSPGFETQLGPWLPEEMRLTSLPSLAVSHTVYLGFIDVHISTRQLRSLHLVEVDDDIFKTLHNILTCSPYLSTLTLQYSRSTPQPNLSMFQAQSLCSLKLAGALTLSSDDLVLVLCTFPRLEDFNLADAGATAPFPLDILGRLSPITDRLKRLRIRLVGEVNEIQRGEYWDRPQPFSHLQVLDVATSPVRDVCSSAVYLRAVLPRPVVHFNRSTTHSSRWQRINAIMRRS